MNWTIHLVRDKDGKELELKADGSHNDRDKVILEALASISAPQDWRVTHATYFGPA